VIDLHTHLLPGIDDGPRDDEGALTLARAAVEAGTHAMAATPHIDHQHGVVVASLPSRLEDIRQALATAGVPLEVHKGGEVAITRLVELSDDELSLVTLGDSRCLLVECPFTPAGAVVDQMVFQVQTRGFEVLLAHPERSPTFQGAPDRLATLVDRGAMVQITAASMVGKFGRTVQEFCFSLFELGLVHVVSSDAHSADRRGPGMNEAFDTAAAMGRSDLAEQRAWWTQDAPAAILAGRHPGPPPPVAGRRRRILGRLGRRQ
jgi:protein-tyrosine phosphatase